MKRIVIVVSALAVFMAMALPANAVVHEQVGAGCGGHVDLSPPGLSDDTKNSFAKPVLSNGVVVVGMGVDAGFLVIGDSPAAKYPAGTRVLSFATGPIDLTGLSDHPSADNCKALNP